MTIPELANLFVKPSPRHFAFHAALLSIILILSSAVNAAHAAESNTTRQDLDAVTRSLNELDNWLTGAKRKRQRWQRELKEQDEQVASVHRSLATTEDRLATIRAELDTLEQQRQLLLKQQQEGAARIAEHLAAAYRLGGQDFIKQLLNQESPEAFDRMIRYHSYFSEAHHQIIASYRTTLAAVSANAAALHKAHQSAAMRREELAQQVQSLDTARHRQLDLLTQLAAETQDKTVERQRLEADQQRLHTLLAELQRKATQLDGASFSKRKGALPWPVKGEIQTRFGQLRAGGRMKWNGVIFGAAQGTPVQAVARGKVVFSDWLRGYGLLAIVDHGSGFLSLYGQAEVLLKNVGEWVEGGEPLARAGRSGGESKPGLYFEIRQKGKVQDPLGWLVKH